MKTATSKLTRKYQATIPAPVREVLQLHQGDTIAFEIDQQEIRIRKASPLDLTFARALEVTLEEWTGDADEAAYHDL